MTKSKILAYTILVWSTLNLILNLVGRGISDYLLNTLFEIDFYWHLKNIGFQVLIFSITTIISFILLGRRKLFLYTFSLLQFIIFHLIFLLGLERHENRPYFISTWDSLGVKFLLSNQQNLIDIISVYFPMYGTFDHGMFIPELTTFYIIWVLLTSIYFFILTWLTDVILTRLIG